MVSTGNFTARLITQLLTVPQTHSSPNSISPFSLSNDDGCVEQQEEGSLEDWETGWEMERWAPYGLQGQLLVRAQIPSPASMSHCEPGPLLEPFTRPWSCLLGGETSQLTRQVWRPSGTQTGAVGPSAHNLFARLVWKREAETQKRAEWTVCSISLSTILKSTAIKGQFED